MKQKLQAFAKKYPSAFRIVLAVVIVHFGCLIAVFTKKSKSSLFVKKPLTVNTKFLPPHKMQVVAHKPKKVKSTIRKKAKKREPKRKKLLKTLEESIAKIDEKRDNNSLKKELTLPKRVDFSQEFVEDDLLEKDYGQLLIDELKNSLKLPQVGEVRLKLTLEKNGRVVDVEVLQSESEANKGYLLGNLQKMTFPPFVDSLKDYDQQTFLLTFCSD